MEKWIFNLFPWFKCEDNQKNILVRFETDLAGQNSARAVVFRCLPPIFRNATPISIQCCLRKTAAYLCLSVSPTRDPPTQFFANSPYASHQLLLALCTRACKAAPADESTTSYTGRMRALLGTGKGRANDEGFAPVGLSPRSYRALARLLRASLDQAAAGKEFLLARSCLVTSGLFAVNGAEYLEWLRAEEAAGSLGREKDELLEAMADVELVSAATSSGGGESTAGGGGGGVGFLNAVGKTPASSGRRTGDYVLQRELRRHPVWATIELWEVALSDSVVIATEGGGARAERWLPAETLSSLKKVTRGFSGSSEI